MNWLARRFGSKPDLTPRQAERLAAWRALPPPRQALHLDHSRCVVVDVETSGLDLRRDRLIAIGAVAVARGGVQLGDSLEIVLQQEKISEKGNILVHGIGGAAQRAGVPPADALLAFLEYLRKDPLVAFHVAFDEPMIRRAMRTFLGLDFRHAWVDLAYVAPALHPQRAGRPRSLDDWMDLFGIGNYARHNALADALSTAQLLLALRNRLDAHGNPSFAGLKGLEREQRRRTHPY